MHVRQQLHTYVRIALKYTINPVTLRLARSSIGPFSIVRHVGRRSGKQYETPIIVSPVEDGFMIELTYGPNVDWRKNVIAAGGCTVFWHGETYAVGTVEPVATAIGRAAFPPTQRFVLRLLGRTHFEKLPFQHPH